MRKVADRDLALLVERRQKGALVVDAEVEDAVLVGQAEVGREDRRVGVRWRRGQRRQGEAVEGREHGEFELDGVVGRGEEGLEVVLGVFGDLDLERLRLFLLVGGEEGAGECTHHVVLDAVDLGVVLRHVEVGSVDAGRSSALVQEVLQAADLEHANLLEGPGSELLGEVLVGRLHVLAVAADLGVKPGVLQHLG